MGINFNAGYNAGGHLPKANNGRVKTTRVTIDGSTLTGTIIPNPHGNVAQATTPTPNNTAELNSLDTPIKGTDLAKLNGVNIHFRRS